MIMKLIKLQDKIIEKKYNALEKKDWIEYKVAELLHREINSIIQDELKESKSI